MAKRKNKKKKNTFSSIFAFDRTREKPYKQQIVDNIVYHAQSLKGNSLSTFLSRVFSHRLCPEEVYCRYKTNKSFLGNYNYMFHSINEELIWFKHLFEANSEELNSFFKLKGEVDLCILNGHAHEALIKITQIEKDICLSFWGLEFQIHVMKELLNEDTSEYIADVKQAMNNNVSNFYLEQMLLKSENKDIESYLDQFLDLLTEMRNTKTDTNIIEFSNLASSYLLPFEYDTERNVDNRRLSNITAYSLIDQYLLYKIYITDKVLHGNGFNQEEMKIINEIKEHISDRDMSNLFNEEVTLNNIDKDYLDVIKDYTEDNHMDCKKKISKLLQLDPITTSCIEVYSRCTIYLDEDKNKNPNYYQNIATYFQNILLMNTQMLESINNLEKISIKFYLSNWSIPILFHLHKFINEKKDLLSISKKKIKLLGSKITPVLIIDYKYEDLINFLEIPQINLSERRQLKLINKSLLDSKELLVHCNNLKNSTNIYSDYLQEVSSFLLKEKKFTECIRFIAHNCLKNSMHYIVLPLNDVINEIEKVEMNPNDINIPIIYDIYSKKINSDKDDEYLERFQDYIDQFESFMPSVIFSHQSVYSMEELYFLKNICIPEVMDVYPEFKTSDNLKKERMSILDILIEVDPKNSENYKKEKTVIFDELIFNKLKTEFDSSKIYVDIESLKKKREDTYHSLFELLCAARSSKTSDEEYVFLDDEEKIWIPSTDMTSVTNKIYTTLFEDFVSNPDYGLDKYLSADIRHGIFVPHMRSGVEKYNLLTEINDTYEDNLFWLDKYALLVGNTKDAMNTALKDFSKEFDDVLNETNNWFKINIDSYEEEEDNQNNGLFDFMLTLDRLSKLKEKVISINDFDLFFNALLEFMWELTDAAAIATKNKLNTTFRQNLLACFDNLETSINKCRGSVPMQELLKEIKLAKNTIHTDLERVLNWFNCVEDKSMEQYSLGATLNACIETFKSISKDNDFSLSFDVKSKSDLFLLTYREARALMSSLFTAFINATTHGTRNTNVNIVIHEEEKRFSIEVSNKLTLEKGLKKEVFLKRLREKQSDKYCDLSTSEGGTGIYKIYNHLNNASERFSFEVNFDNDIFSIKIGIEK